VTSPVANEVADVLIVGAGAAGVVIAARLSEDPATSVALVEAGPARWDEALNSGSFFDALSSPGRMWVGLNAQRSAGGPATPYIRGRGLGGSGAVNAMVMLPPDASDLYRWQQAGAWGAELADVRTAIDIRPTTDAEIGPLSGAMLAADPLAIRAPIGRTADGQRGMYRGYVAPLLGRPNVRILGDLVVDRVLFEGRRALGVRCADGQEILAHHVIISAGAIHSPAILLRSHVDTPGVGDGLQDHPSAPINIRMTVPPVTGTMPIAALIRCSSSIGVDDLQILPTEGIGGEHAVLMAAVMEVSSRGRVRLADDDPLVEPLIEFRMLSDKRDACRLADALGHIERLLATTAMRRVCEPLDTDFSLAAARPRLGDYVHAAGTCAMGRVVDTSCALRGYQALYVCDASVMPAVPRVNTHLPTAMVAERFCELWRQR